MKIGIVQNKKYYSPSFKKIIYKSYNPKYDSNKEPLRNEIDSFSKNPYSCAKFLGQGVCAKAYELDNFDDFVIKEATSKDDFSLEEKGLRLLDNEINNVQRFVARAYDDKKDKFYLLTTKINGNCADYIDNLPLNKNQLDNFFDVLFELDSKGIYHGDLNCGNIIIDGDNVSLLDFQYATKLDRKDFFKNLPQYNTPDFMMLENAYMFEQAGLPYYISKLENKEKKEFFKNYLQEKSHYHSKRANFIKNELLRNESVENFQNIQKALNYETTRSKVFLEPNEDIIKLEAKKTGFLNSFRQAYSLTDEKLEHRNIIPSASSYLYSLILIKDFLNEIKRQELNDNDMYKAMYLKGMEEFGKYWFENMKTWTNDIFYFPIRHALKEKEPWEDEIYDFYEGNTDVNDFGAIQDFASKIDENYKINFQRGFEFIKSNSEKTNDKEAILPILRMFADWQNHKIEEKKEIYNDLKSLINEINKKIDKLNNGADEPQNRAIADFKTFIKPNLNNAFKNKRALDVINLAVLSVLKAGEIEDKTLQKDCLKLAKLTFFRTYEEIINNRNGLYDNVGYENINDFRF